MPRAKRPTRSIYALGGLALPPEANAYGLARYSRSAESAKTTFSEMAEKMIKDSAARQRFFEVFYFQYGHASIADLAHVPMAIENVSMVAAMEIVDEPLWDGQERSTRYQKFSAEAVHLPAPLLRQTSLRRQYQTSIKYLMAEYAKQFQETLAAVRTANVIPPDYSESAYKAATRARAFDITRYLLPLGALTSVGQYTSGRTLEKMISRLFSSQYSEVRAVAEELKRACQTPAFNPFSKEISAALAAIGSAATKTRVRRLRSILKTAAPLPTLIKYTAPQAYLIETRKDLQQAARELLHVGKVESNYDVKAFISQPPLVEAVATALYWVTHYSYQQIYQQVSNWSEKKLASVYELAVRRRGQHDELLRALDTHSITFDILMDVGSYRDLHRHRRTVQVAQDYTYQHGYSWHPELEKYGNLYAYQQAMDTQLAVLKKLAKREPEAAVYAMPMGFKRRALFKMGWNELDYIGKLRTGGGRHQSYWKMALRMVEEVAKLSPAMAKHIPTKPLATDSVYER